MYMFFIGPALLPVTPSTLDVSIGGNNQVVTLINDGEINILHDPKLKEIAFSALLPGGQKYPFAFYSMDGNDAVEWLTYLQALQAQKIPFPFIITKTTPGKKTPKEYQNILAVIEEIQQTEDASNGPDVIVQLRLREYREYSTIRVKESGGKYTAERSRPKSYTEQITKLAKKIMEKSGA